MEDLRSFKDLRVLIVDDDDVDRMAIRRTLGKLGLSLTIEEVTDARSAIASLRGDSGLDGAAKSSPELNSDGRNSAELDSVELDSELSAQATARTYDWVLLDYRLPDLDGLSLVKKLRREGLTLPLIVLTGQGDEQIAVELMKAGASDYVAKARVSPESLLRTLRNAFRLHRAEQRTAAARQQLRETNELLMQQNQALEQQRQKIEQQNLQLLEAYQLKSEFLATMSHELRTPLNAILGFSQVLQQQTKGPLNAYQNEIVNRIFSNGKHLLELVNDILDLSKIEAKRLVLEPSHIDLSKLIAVTIDELRSLFESKPLELHVQVQLQDPMIYNDEQRLRQVLVNLISNAIKFTDQGYVKIAVHAPDDHSIEIRVEDTGIGIAPSQLAHIFEAFRQADQSIRRRHSGTGLGLAITESLVSMMGGTISAESQLGKGSVFCVNIPQRIADHTPRPTPSAAMSG